jgi:hypothetical protein
MSHQSPSISARFGLPPHRLSGALSRAAGRIVAFLLAVTLVLAPPATRAAGDSGEYEQKARIIGGFIKNTTWPENKMGRPGSPFIIGIYGNDQIVGYLQEIYAGSLIKGHPAQFRQIYSKDDISSCHLLFVSGSERERLKSILVEARREHVLTVGESDNFLTSGGIIQFVPKEGGGWVWVTNEANAARERLKLGAFILRFQKSTSVTGPREDAARRDDRRLADTPEP